MKVGLVALHYPHPEHRDEMISRVRQAADVTAAAPGCLAADCWVSEDGQAAVTTGQSASTSGPPPFCWTGSAPATSP